jgi:SHS2 domain-containing protein
MRYEEIDHTADLAARIYGKDFPELFENAAFCMFDMAGDLSGAVTYWAELTLKAADKESLLIKWLNELLFMSFDKKILFSAFNVSFPGECELKAKVGGSGYEGREYLLKKEIKAATYHEVKIENLARGYEVVIVFDV